jgi:hypothetical protein
MKPSKLYEALHALIGERVPLHIWGACGVGKSQIVSQVANDLDHDFLDVRAVQLDPVDLRGLPRIAEDQTEWVPPKFLPTTGKGILFLDELTSAPQVNARKRIGDFTTARMSHLGIVSFSCSRVKADQQSSDSRGAPFRGALVCVRRISAC